MDDERPAQVQTVILVFDVWLRDTLTVPDTTVDDRAIIAPLRVDRPKRT